MKIIDYIPVGHKNAVTRKQLVILTGLSDRKIRNMIQEECNREHPILNMQDGKGYFQPAYDEMHLVRLYRAQENHRTLAGVFGTTTAGAEGTPAAETRMKDHILDLTTGKTDAAKQISASAFIDACQLLGDAQAQLSGVAMHSATKSYLKKLNLIDTERDSTDVEFDTYQGRRVTVDDGCPVADGVYTTYLFGNGAVAYGNGSPTGFVSTEVDRDKQTGGGIDYLINRKAFILHPRGIAYTGAKRDHVETPLRTELAMAENWKPVYEPKQLRIVAIKHKIG